MRPWLGFVFVCSLAVLPGCMASDAEYTGFRFLSADYSATDVRFQFNVGKLNGRWAWYIMLDTDQLTDVNGKKTGLGEFGEEFRVQGRDQVADSVAVRPTSGPVDPAPGAYGWPLPVGYARLDPAATVSLTIPKSILADDGLMSFEIWVVDPDGNGFYDSKKGVTTPRPGSVAVRVAHGRTVAGAR